MIHKLVLKNGTVFEVGKGGISDIEQEGSRYIVRFWRGGDQIIVSSDVRSVT